MKTTSYSAVAAACLGLCLVSTGTVAASEQISKSPPFWTFVAPPPAGMTKLVRTPQGLTAQFKTTGLTAGHAVTLWIMFFDNPGACVVPGECNLGDIGRPGVGFDFHYAGGRVVNDQYTTISGHLQVSDTSGSGFAELVEVGGAPPFFVTPLTNPFGAQVILAIHSHGPAQKGEILADQISSYLGGCVWPFLTQDPGGFAGSADEIPTAPGECATFQVAFHNPVD